MKEFEEELVELRRENFDLKMRIYLMEEQQELLYGSTSIDEVQKLRHLNVCKYYHYAFIYIYIYIYIFFIFTL